MIAYLDLQRVTHAMAPEIEGAVRRVIASGIYIQGAEVESFENDFAEYCGSRHCIGVGNGLDALTLSLRAAGIGQGDEVIVPSNTYIATWLAVSATQARVVPVEPLMESYCLDPVLVERAITPRTRAIVAVHLYGFRADLDALSWVARRHGTMLLVDAAQGHGLAAGGDAQAFSFYPTKNLGALGDGGAVVTDDDELASRVRLLANYGSRQKYHHEVAGMNSRLDPMQAAVLRVKLRFLCSQNARRQAIARRYLEGLAGLPGLILPNPADDSSPVWHVFPVRHTRRDGLAERLHQAGIGTLVHYPIPPHLSGAYRGLGYRRGDFPIAEEIADTELSLPLYPQLTDQEVDCVIGRVRAAVLARAGQWLGEEVYHE